jgi:hypothetical protein
MRSAGVIIAILVGIGGQTQPVLLKPAVARSSVVGQPRRPPGEPRGVIVDYARPPATLRGLFAEVAVVVRGRVTASSSRPRGGTPLTAHDFQIDDVFKTDPAVGPKTGSIITVIQHGGTIVGQNGTEITGGLNEIVKPGQELIVFLFFWRAEGAFTPAYGPHSTFLMIDKEVLVPETLRSYPEFDGHTSVPTATFVQLLRQLAVEKQ